MASDGAEPAAATEPQPDRVEGEWHPPRSNLSRPAALIAGEAGLAVVATGGGELAAGQKGAVTVSVRVGNIERRVTFPDGSVFVTGDNDGLDRLLAGGRAPRFGVHQAEAFHWRLVAFVAATVIFAVLLYRYALPLMVEVAVAVTPPVVPAMMSQGALATLDTAVFHPSRLGDAEQASIAADFARLAALSPRETMLSVHFRDGGAIGANAFALPDGTIVVTDQLVALTGADREMLLGVLAHEIGHVDEEHSLRQFYRAAGVAGLVMLIGGDIGDGVDDILMQGSGLMALSYSRHQEEAADRTSVRLMAKAGYDPAAIARFFETLEAKGMTRGDGATEFLSTHPETAARRRAVLDYAGEIAGRAD